ncbi:hypothetical protein [Vulcanococcus limneticus]|uniref:hypothetical protein n=1 Tax=Vulcanococcus limneticus TaxID=2170428 RepID=UPI00398C1B82
MTRLRGRAVVRTGLLGAGVGLTVALLLRAVIRQSTVELSGASQFWLLVLLVGGCATAGLALEAVHQLQEGNPDQAYRHPRGRGPRQP